MTDFTFKMLAGDIDADLTIELQSLDLQRVKIVEELRKKMMQSLRYKAAMDLVGHSKHTYRKMSPTAGWTGSGFDIPITMDRPSQPEKSYVSPVHIDPKTMNALLNGKILTDKEKRKLISSVLPAGVLAEAPIT